MQYIKWSAPAAMVLVALAGCNPSDSADSDSASDKTNITLDASSGWAYLNLESKSEVEVTGDWDLAFYESHVRSNPNRVELALAAPQEDFFDDTGRPDANVFLNATKSSELEHFDANYEVADLTFEPDAIDAVVGRDSTNFYSGSTANTDAWWIVKSAEGDSYAKLNFTNYSYNGGTHEITVEANFFVKGSGDSVFSSTPVTWQSHSLTTSEACFDFDSGSTVSCASSTWDVQYFSAGHVPMILLNSDYSGDGSAGLYIFDDKSDSDASNDDHAMTQTEVDAVDVSTLASAEFSTDQENESNMFYNAYPDYGETYNDWFVYAGAYSSTFGAGNHGIYPNFRVYAAQYSNDDVYLFQIINYYNEADEGKHISVRVRPLDE